jgi:hypothetical protein
MSSIEMKSAGEEIVGDLNRAFSAFKEANDERLAQIETRMGADAVTEEKLTRIDQALDETKGRLDRLALDLARPRIGGAAPADHSEREHKSAFDTYMRSGETNGLKALEAKAMSRTSGADGGYGRARIGGQMIWSTRFLETTNVSYENTSSNSGGKGGGGGGGGGGGSVQTNVTYSYFANFAIGLCEGSIAFLRRIWADGSELDLTTLPIRIYSGGEDQEPDPLIVAKEGGGDGLPRGRPRRERAQCLSRHALERRRPSQFLARRTRRSDTGALHRSDDRDFADPLYVRATIEATGKTLMPYAMAQ